MVWMPVFFLLMVLFQPAAPAAKENRLDGFVERSEAEPVVHSTSEDKGGFVTLPEAGPIVHSTSEANGWFVARPGIDLLSGGSGHSLRVKLTLAFQYTERFSAGIGAGYVFYHDPADLIPVYFDLVYDLGAGGIVPYIQLKAGYSYSIFQNKDLMPDRHRGGIVFNPAVGLQFRDRNRQGIYLSAGFNLDHSSYDQDAFGGRIVREKISYRRISLGFGFIF